MRKIAIAILLLASSTALAGQTAGSGEPALPSSMVLARVGAYMPSAADFRTIYGTGLVFGGELRIGVGRLAGWAEGNYRSRSGQTTFSKEPTDVSVLAFEGGALYRLRPGRLCPYAGAGLGYYGFKESSKAMGTAKKGGIGVVGLAGVSAFLSGRLALDLRVKYGTCSMTPVEDKVNIGGLTVGLGLGFGF